MNEQIVLGSGDLYVMAYEGSTIPSDAEIETQANRIGYIKGGASLEYKPTELEIRDDSNTLIKRFTTGEEITFKSGILTWDLSTLNKLSQAAGYSDTNNVRTLRLGNKGVKEMKQFVIHFVHTKSDNNTVKVTLVGTASNGFSLSFTKDAETVIDAEFKAISHDSNGTQLIIAESYETE